MRERHVRRQLSAYCQDQLPEAEARRVGGHVLRCTRCRRELDEVRQGIKLAEQLVVTNAPVGIWERIETALDHNSVDTATAPPRNRFFLSPARLRFAALSVALVVMLGAALFFYVRSFATPSWEVARLSGAPTIGAQKIGADGKLKVGEWLETDASSRALVNVSRIGELEVEPNSRLQLVETGQDEHRIALERGRLSARIWAPPRLFFVNTPSAEAIDLGCAYTLDVDEAGRSLLHVTSGWVALALNGREAKVPAGGACATQPGIGPGTPYFVDAPAAFIAALRRFDFENGGRTALLELLAAARPHDTLTLWNLLPRASGADRERVLDRLWQFAAAPEGVTREGILRLDEQMLARWQQQLEASWVFQGRSTLQTIWQ